MQTERAQRAKIIGKKKERKNSFENYAPKTHTEHKEYRGNKCRIKNGKFGQGRAKGRREELGKLYNCCKGVWLGGQRNNQLKALMASDGVAVQGRWQVSDWGWSCDWGCGWGMWCASAANNGAMASVISCNCFPSFMTTTSSSVSASCSVSLSLSPYIFIQLAFAFSWPNEACKFQALAAALTPFSLLAVLHSVMSSV